MKCKYCQTPLDWGQTTCPECGRENPRPEKKKTPAALWIACAAVVLIAAALIALVVVKNRKDAGGTAAVEGAYSEFTVPERNYTVDTEKMTADVGSQVVGTCNDMNLDNTTLSYYYWHAYYTYASYLAGYVDNTKGLEEQTYGERTWQQVLLDQALINWEECQALAAEAEKQGGEIVETAQKNVDLTLENMQKTVDESDQFETLDDYLHYYYGPTASAESYTAYARASQLANLYVEQVADGITYTDADINEYYNQHLSDYLTNGIEKSDVSNISVRHILIKPEDTSSDDSWAQAEKKAQDLLEQWKTGDATEDSFAALAEENSEDPGSVSNGGLYDDVAPGQMVDTFNDWCFDESRQPGDTGIVKTTYGYHIMYFVGDSGTYQWYEEAKQDYVAEKQNEKLLEIMKNYGYTLDFGKMSLINSPLYTG